MDDFMLLTEFLNYPLRSGDEVVERFEGVKKAVTKRTAAEKMVYIPGKRKDRVLMVAHADTAWDRTRIKEAPFEHKVVFRGGFFRSETENAGIGANDRAGCSIIWLLKDLGHSILIIDGKKKSPESCSFLEKEFPEIIEELNETHQFVVKFDGSKGHSFKCSKGRAEKFRDYIAEETGFAESGYVKRNSDDNFYGKICKTHLSMGLYSKNRSFEKLNYIQWEDTLNMSRKWLVQKDLPKFIRS